MSAIFLMQSLGFWKTHFLHYTTSSLYHIVILTQMNHVALKKISISIFFFDIKGVYC